MVGVVQHINVARLHAAVVLANHGLDALAHRAQVHRHVRRIGNQVALCVKQRARKIQALLDVHRVRGVLQLQAHLLGDVHEQVVEHLEQHRVHPRASGVLHRTCLDPLQHQMVQCGQLCAPAGLDHSGGIALGDDGRAGDVVACAQILSHHQGSLHPLALGVHAHSVASRHLAHRVGQTLLLGSGIAGNDGLDGHGLHHQAFAGHEKRKALAVGCLKGRLNLLQ